MTDKIKCLVVDDEELARALLQNYIEKLPNLEVVGLCANPLEALHIMQKEHIDILFLDIQMPGLTGIKFLSTLSIKPLVIFTTAYTEYAVQGFNLDAVDYLLKPFRFERFLRAVNKSVSLLQNQPKPEPKPIESISTQKVDHPRNYLLVKSEFKVFRIMFDDILYIESMREYVAYHTREKRILSLGSLKGLLSELPSSQFIRIHKSYVVNIAFISAMEGNMIHIGDQKLPIGGMYKDELKKRVF